MHVNKKESISTQSKIMEIFKQINYQMMNEITKEINGEYHFLFHHKPTQNKRKVHE